MDKNYLVLMSSTKDFLAMTSAHNLLGLTTLLLKIDCARSYKDDLRETIELSY